MIQNTVMFLAGMVAGFGISIAMIAFAVYKAMRGKDRYGETRTKDDTTTS